MRIDFACFAVVGFVLGACACAVGEPDESVFDPKKVREHFAAQRKCDRYISKLLTPAAKLVREEDTIEELRNALGSIPDDEFSAIVARVQRAAQGVEDFNPRTDRSQLRVSILLYDKMAELPSFSESGCGPDLREVVMDHLYWKLGGETSAAVLELRAQGIEGHSEVKWVLMTSLLGP